MSFIKVIEILILVFITFVVYLKLRKMYLKNTRKEVKREHNLQMKLQRDEMLNVGKAERSENVRRGFNDYVSKGGLKNDVGNVAKTAVDYKLNNFKDSNSSTNLKDR